MLLRDRELWQWVGAGVLSLAIVLLAHQGTFVGIERSFSKQDSGDLAALAEAREVIQRRWVETPKDGQLRDGALAGMAATLDPFSAYIPPRDQADFERSTTGKFGGLGIWVGLEQGRIVVIAPIEGTPAWDAGILPGDVVVSVDGVARTFASVTEAVEALKGEVDTSVVLEVRRAGETETRSITVTRAQIQIRSVKGARLLDPVSKVGYLRVTTFNGGTFPEVREAIEALLAQGMRALILDLRGNPGGLLDQAVRVANLWLPDDAVILSTWSREQATSRGDARPEGAVGAEDGGFPASGYQHTVANSEHLVHVPSVVLIDGGSASASEVLGGALQDHGKAKLIGTRSYGKGSVQTIVSLQGGKAAVKLTTQYYFTPKKRRIHRGSLEESDLSWGLIPDQRVEVAAARLRELSRIEADYELERLKAKARSEEFTQPEQLHLIDPQARAGYRILLAALGEPVPAEAEVAPVGSASSAPLESAGLAPVESGSAGLAPVESGSVESGSVESTPVESGSGGGGK